MNLDSLISEALIHVNGNAAGQTAAPMQADPGTVLLAYAHALEQGDQPAARGVLEFLNPASKFADGILSTFATWRPYTDPKTGRSGYISDGGLVRYKDMRKADEPAAVDPGKLLADPEKIGDEHLAAVRAHLESLPPDRLAAAARELVAKATPEDIQAADGFMTQRGGKTGSLLAWAEVMSKRDADKAKAPELPDPKEGLMKKGHDASIRSFFTGDHVREWANIDQLKNNWGIHPEVVGKFIDEAIKRGVLQRGMDHHLKGGVSYNEWKADPNGPRYKVADRDGMDKLLNDLNGEYGRKFKNTPGTGERVKLDHVGDPEHPIAKALATDKHVQEVFAKLAPHLERARPVYADFAEKAAAFKAALEKDIELGGRIDAIDEKYKDIARATKVPKAGTKAAERWQKRHDKWQAEREAVADEKDRHWEKVRFPALDASRKARDAAEAMDRELAPKIWEALKPEKPVHVNGAFTPPAGVPWYKSTDEDYEAAPVQSPAGKEEWGNAKAFVESVCGHQREIPLVFGVSKAGRGFHHHVDGGPSFVTFNRDPMDTEGSRRYSRSVAVHEIGHAIERASPGLVDDSKAFADYRCGDEPQTKLDERFKDCGYAEYEYGRKDQFDRSWDTEGDSSPYYIGKTYANATEVISMGIQQLHDAPARFILKDPEYVAFLIRSLRRDS